jgi:hypothetical protein
MPFRNAVVLVLLWGAIFAFFPLRFSSAALEKFLGRDTDGDGRIDQATYLNDRGDLVLRDFEKDGAFNPGKY